MAARQSKKAQQVQSEEVVDQNQTVEQVEVTEPVVEVVESGSELVQSEETTQADIDKENKIVDLESEIVKLTERLSDLKKELRKLTKPTKNDGPTKMELAVQYWKENQGKARKEYVEAFQKELGLTLAGARTYIQIIMTKNKVA
ncbi:hypothetical protein [Azonexus hydrophilus]|uniref:hypothetical protein n=1 Tax=Azonexus hydrophilus TaxID=418702 RepID=UPI0004103829|nr:hypothetical protein [Azonexus hydrophilus]